MYYVRFIRNDYFSDEEYAYHALNDAEYHYGLFIDDDSGRYLAIQLMNEDTILHQNIVGFTQEEIEVLKDMGTPDQYQTCMQLMEESKSPNQEKRTIAATLRVKLANITAIRFPQFIDIVRNW